MTGKKIFLIGMPGSGKSHTGRELARELKLSFIDLDEEIINVIGMSIADYFAIEGEAIFREIERKTLRRMIESQSSFIMSTGGGVPCFFDNLELMKKSGFTIFLDTPKEILIERNMQSSERPLMMGDVEKKVAGLLETRLAIYQKAHFITSAPDPKDLANEVAQFFKN